MKIRPYFLSLGVLFFLFSCDKFDPPEGAFDLESAPPSPDYSDLSYWSAHPEKQDWSDSVPQNLSSLPPISNEEAKVDIFFIHPTTFYGGKEWNASLQDEEVNARTDKWAIRHQASIFNASGRVYAPRYRQMVLGGFYGDDSLSMMKAIGLAYRDVKESFEYYLEHYNQGRPIIIASHSQGSIHGIRLIKEFFDQGDLKEQLVCGYLPGWPLPADTFKTIPICNDPQQTGCVVSWCSWKRGKRPKKEELQHFYDDAVVVNPLTWKVDDTYASEKLHEGYVGASYKKIKDHKIDAQAHEGMLWISQPSFFLNGPNYHIGDYNLFWMDVRRNAIDRSEAFLGQAERTAFDGKKK